MSNEHVEAIRQHTERLRIGSRSSDRWLYADSINKHADALARRLAEAEARAERAEGLSYRRWKYINTGEYGDHTEIFDMPDMEADDGR